MKIKLVTLIVLTVVALTGCASSVPKPPEPKGKLTPVNPVEIKLADLKT